MTDFIRLEEERLAQRPAELPFSREEYAARLALLRTRMAESGLDILLITSPDGMCWLHGYDARWYRSHSSTCFPPTHCTVVHVDHDRILLIEVAEHEQLVRLTSCVDDFRGIPETDLDGFTDLLAAELAARGWTRGTVGVERWSALPNPAGLAAIEAMLTTRGYGLADATTVIRRARRIKSTAEITMIEHAQAACDAGITELHRQAYPGMTELEAWNTYMTGMIAAGGEPTAMHETIAVGPPMPMLHGVSTRRKIQRGDYFHADVAGAVHRYHARGTRPFFVGEPPPWFTDLAKVIAGAHDVLTATARPGLPFRDLHRALREYFAEAGVDGWAGGYELGVSLPPDWVGEFVWSSSDEDTEDVIEAGLVTNFESVAFLAMVDTVVFDRDGARLLSTLPREVMIVEVA
ncbi:Xaa-Pro peptidase family protein [Sphaerisporangium sp. NPDC051017]|uniref:M24 family metallopeptidase n=1 Tax=Sphaerisporangium sp. NPDC051017 TaxID=3154636 RepID=UPI003432BFD1